VAETLKADYLIAGAGVSGMAFADVLLTYTDKTILLADRRHAPGGHWNDAYPFARLHQPSGSYGADSAAIGGYGLDPEGDPALYERATAAEVCAFYDRLLHQRFLPSGRVRFLSATDHLGDGLLASTLTGETMRVDYGKLVNATYLEGTIPATSPPPFEVAEGMCCIAPGDLVRLKDRPEGFVVIGAGKTGQDVVLYLLAAGVPPEAIRWVRPRDPWLTPRLAAQPGPGLPGTVERYRRGIEIATRATSLSDLLHQLEAAGGLIRIDPEIEPEAFVSAIISDWQLSELRRIRQVIRLGHVKRISHDRVELDQGSIPTGPGFVHIHCAASGVIAPPYRTIFQGRTITPQAIRYGLTAYSMSLLGFVEATIADDELKNRLCIPFAKSGTPVDWVRGRLRDFENTRRWAEVPDLLAFANQTPVNTMAGLAELRQQEPVKSIMAEVAANLPAAEANMRRILDTVWVEPDVPEA